MNRARWLRVLRWLVTAIGCYWIATSLTLDDHLVLPAGFVKDGVVLTAETRSVPVAEIRPDTVVIICAARESLWIETSSHVRMWVIDQAFEQLSPVRVSKC